MSRFWLLRAIRLRLRPNDTSVNYAEFLTPTNLSNNISITVLDTLPGATSALTISPTGVMGTQALGGGGTVTSFAASAPSDLLGVSVSNATTTPNLTLTKVNQAANRFYGSPVGAVGDPTFRAIAFADVAALGGNTATSFALGNDSRLHTQNTDSGTTLASFALDSGNAGVRLKNASGVLQVRNAADSAMADLSAANVTISGNLTVTGNTVSGETVTIQDNIIELNSNVTTGTPTENGGIQLRRGASVSASLLWNESGDFWQAGLVGSELPICRRKEVAFTSANVTAGQFTFNHGLEVARPDVFLVDGNGKRIGSPDDVTYTGDLNNCTIDLTFLGPIVGTWYAVGIG